MNVTILSGDHCLSVICPYIYSETSNMMVHTCIYSTWETEAGRSHVLGQSGYIKKKEAKQDKQKPLNNVCMYGNTRLPR
jgi:hypothetical protein